MSIKQIDKTTFERTYPSGEVNLTEEITVTKEGIEIDLELISWEEIDAAREFIEKKTQLS